MTIASTTNAERSWGDVFDVIDRVVATANSDITAAGAAEFTIMANQPDSVAADVATLVSDFNALLDKLKASGLMTPDA